jgi:outer membrane protein assembly factor BamB
MRTATPFVLAAVVSLGCTRPIAVQDTPSPSTMAVAWQQDIDVAGLRYLAVGPRAVFVTGSESGVSAYAREDGRRLWSQPLTAAAQPVAIGGVVVVPAAERIEAFDQGTGEPRWRLAASATPPAIVEAAGDLVLLRQGAVLRALGPDGAERWQVLLPAEPATPVIRTGEALLVGLTTSALAAIDPATGATKWTAALPSTPTALVAIDDQLFAPGTDGVLYAFRIARGVSLQRLWRHRAVATVGAPAIGDRRVYVAMIDNTVKAFDRGGGSRVWSSPVRARPVTGPLLLGDTIIVPLSNGELAQILAASGRPPQDEQARPAGILARMSAAAVADGAMYAVVTAQNEATTLVAWRGAPPR